MTTIIVDEHELLDVMQYINLVKIKFGYEDIWFIAPVLYAAQTTVDVLLNVSDDKIPVRMGEKVIIKFQRFGFEYILSGEISDMSESTETATAAKAAKAAQAATAAQSAITIRYTQAKKYQNFRKHMRFDTNLKATVDMDSVSVDCMVKNISKGGAMISIDKELKINSDYIAHISFESGNILNTHFKVLREAANDGRIKNFGIEFSNVPQSGQDILDMEIGQMEKHYFKWLYSLRDYEKKGDMCYETKIAIFSHNSDESYEVREVLIKLGAENFEVFHSFKFFDDYFSNETPKIIIADSEEINEEIVGFIQKINQSFANITIILMVPIDQEAKQTLITELGQNIILLYNPLIYNEFEQEILKYL